MCEEQSNLLALLILTDKNIPYEHESIRCIPGSWIPGIHQDTYA